MNQLSARIHQIETDGHLSLVTLSVGQTFCSALVLDTPETAAYLRVGQAIQMVFKETEVGIGKELQGGLSLRNRFPGPITSLEQGKILTKLQLDFQGSLLTSVITTVSALALDLHVGQRVEGLVKSTDITLMHAPE